MLMCCTLILAFFILKNQRGIFTQNHRNLRILPPCPPILCPVGNKLCRYAYGYLRGGFRADGKAYGGVYPGDVLVAYPRFGQALIGGGYFAAAANNAHIACGSAKSLLEQLIVSLMAPCHYYDIVLRPDVYSGGHLGIWCGNYALDPGEKCGV